MKFCPKCGAAVDRDPGSHPTPVPSIDHDKPKSGKARRRLIIGVGAVAVLALGGSAFALVSGHGVKVVGSSSCSDAADDVTVQPSQVAGAADSSTDLRSAAIS